MGNDLEKGTTYAEGQQVNAANLNAHVDNATIKYTAINSKSLKDPAALSDEILINDAGVLKKITLQQISSIVTIPPGCIMDYSGATEPTGWLLCYGQNVSRTTYSALFTAIGTTYGSGDGSSTFSLPDCRGRVVAGKDNMGGSSSDRLTTAAGGLDGDILGNSGGLQTHTLTTAQLAAHTHVQDAHNHNQNAHSHTLSQLPAYSASYLSVTGGGVAYALLGGGSAGSTDATQASNVASTATNQNAGGGAAHPNVQPTIVFNKIIKT